MMIHSEAKQRWSIFGFIGVVLLLITSPFWLWFLKQEQSLQVLILDKTVPDQTYREHNGLVWLLNYEKYVTKEKDRYSSQTHYFGFIPKENGQYEVKALPEQLQDYDVFYIADQYGVYEKEYRGTNQEGERSEQIYGGLTEAEVDSFQRALLEQKGKTLVAEFNTFASPTTVTAREKMANLLQVDWSGWIGRYFSDLDSEEVPVWVKENYKKVYGTWKFSGNGFVLVNQNDYIIVLDKEMISGQGVAFSYTKAGEELFADRVTANYHYWFDITEARAETDTLATYQLPVNQEGKKQLSAFHIPTTFPAIVRNENAAYSSFYLAGDFADETEIPRIYQTRGLAFWREKTSDSFFWQAYVPTMKHLLARTLNQTTSQVKIETTSKNGLTINAKAGETYLQIQKDGKWQDLLIKGVNMGIAKPGHFPGETAITKEEYTRWFQAIGNMNANAIRVYTVHPPAFYEAFYEYNETAKEPLYLFHGTWVNEELLVHSQNAYADEVIADFSREMKQVVDILHGQADIAESPGHASGTYTRDISKYVLGLILGIEWDPDVVVGTNQKNQGKSYKGTFFQAEDASPFEVWLAERMDQTAVYEAEKYGWQHNMSFTNWVTTDLLTHPAEPNKEEDLVSVNPNHIKPTDSFQAGMFASYHIYPYYPDFLNYEPSYAQFMDQSGQENNYAGYIRELRSVHEMPVVVAEFGVPASRGLTHVNVHGMDQGNHSEKEQGNINKRLFETMVAEKYAGGLVFTWQDEWFKRTWNTMDYDDPNRRPFWSNLQTNEQMFGLLGFTPGEANTSFYVDGQGADWKLNRSQPLSVAKVETNKLKALYASVDEANMYIRLDFHEAVDLEQTPTYLLIDTIPDQGQTTIDVGREKKVDVASGIDFVVKLAGKKHSSVMVDSYYDTFYYHYGSVLKMIPEVPYAHGKNNGIFHPIRLALNKELVIPSTGERLPLLAYETGKLTYGNGNPDAKNYNSLTDVSVSPDRKMIELRIPWLMVNVKDPSLKVIMGDVWSGGIERSMTVDTVQIGAVVSSPSAVFTLPQSAQENAVSLVRFSWPNWEEPTYHERLKQSYDIMKKTYGRKESLIHE